MPRPFSLFSRKKPTRSFKDYFKDWFNALKNSLLPLLRQSLSSSSPTLLSFHVDLLLQHFLSYYDSLDRATSVDTVPHLLFPSWRNPLEVPFLFLGDIHPYIFTNLVRSFIERENDEVDTEIEDFGHLDLDHVNENRELLGKPWQIVVAWRNPPKNLITRIEQIECGLRLMVPALVSRMRKAQTRFVGRVTEGWVLTEENKTAVDEAVKEEMEEMMSVFLDANRLRKSVIMEIVGAMSIYQAALFLEGLAQFLVGFRDPVMLAELDLQDA